MNREECIKEIENIVVNWAKIFDLTSIHCTALNARFMEVLDMGVALGKSEVAPSESMGVE